MNNPDIIQYQNANQSFDSIVKNFIVRTNEFVRVMDDIRSTDDSSSFQHYIFVGRRGSGKSTLLRRIQAEINLDLNLHGKYEVVNLGEEQSFIYRLYDLWDYVIRELNALGYKITNMDFREYKGDMKSYTKDLHNQIINALRSNNKRLVLLLDNIDRILDSRSGNMDASLLRELLINFHEIRIIGGSTIMSEHFWKYDKPFYQFFTIKKLEALSIKEVEQLLIHWSQIKQIPEIKNIIERHPGKLQSIRMLTDGMPRTMLLFVDMMINRPEQNGYQYLQQLVDKATPIYQERLGVLSDAQKKVLSELAFIWEAASVEELVPKCNIEGKVISAILNQLTDIKYVEKIKTKNKNNLYRVEERFFNLWFNMTQGGFNNRAKAKALTDFLENWYEKSELNDLCAELSKVVNKGEATNDYIEAMSQALLSSNLIENELKDELLTVLKIKGFSVQDFYNKNFIQKIKDAYENKEYELAIELLEKSDMEPGEKYLGMAVLFQELGKESEAEKYYLHALDKENWVSLFNLANLYKGQGREKDAEKYFLLAIDKGNIDALNNLANLYKGQGREKDAEKYFLLAINKGNVNALNNLAILYTNQGKTEEAEKYFLLAIVKGQGMSLFNLAILYTNQGKIEEAEKYFQLAISRGDISSLNYLAIQYAKQGKVDEAENYFLLAISKQDVDALNNLAKLYLEQGKIGEAEKYFLLAIDKGVINAFYNLAILYKNQGKIEEAEKYFLLAIENGNVKALNSLALLYENQGKVSKAENYYRLAIEKGDVDALNNLASYYLEQGNETEAEKYFLLAYEREHVEAIFNLGNLYQHQGKEAEAEKYYLLAIKKGMVSALLNLANLYKNQGKETKAEEFYLQAIEKGDVNALNNLAFFYQDQSKNTEAEKYYLLAIEKGDINAINNITLLHYSKNRKTEIKKLIKNQSPETIDKFINNHFDSAVLTFLFIGDMSRFTILLEKYLTGEKPLSSLIIERLLIHKQNNWVYKYFISNQEMVEKYNPLFYATLYLLGDKEQEILKMPPEIKENVDSILDRIKAQQKFYGH